MEYMPGALGGNHRLAAYLDISTRGAEYDTIYFSQ